MSYSEIFVANLQALKYVLVVPESLRMPISQDLLKTISVPRLEEDWRHFQDMQEGLKKQTDRWDSDYYSKQIAEFSKTQTSKVLEHPIVSSIMTKHLISLTKPVYFQEESWKEVVKDLGISVYGRPTYIEMGDGSVTLVKHISVLLGSPEYQQMNWDERRELSRRFRQDLGIKVNTRHKLLFKGDLFVQTGYFTPDRIQKIRRRVEDRLRKGKVGDIFRVAEMLSLM